MTFFNTKTLPGQYRIADLSNSATTLRGVKYKYIKSFSYFQLFLIPRAIQALFFTSSFMKPRTSRLVCQKCKLIFSLCTKPALYDMIKLVVV